MIISFICDDCNKEIKGEPQGYPEDGDICKACWVESEINDCYLKIKSEDEAIERHQANKRAIQEEINKLLGEVQ